MAKRGRPTLNLSTEARRERRLAQLARSQRNHRARKKNFEGNNQESLSSSRNPSNKPSKSRLDMAASCSVHELARSTFELSWPERICPFTTNSPLMSHQPEANHNSRSFNCESGYSPASHPVFSPNYCESQAHYVDGVGMKTLVIPRKLDEDFAGLPPNSDEFRSCPAYLFDSSLVISPIDKISQITVLNQDYTDSQYFSFADHYNEVHEGDLSNFGSYPSLYTASPTGIELPDDFYRTQQDIVAFLPSSIDWPCLDAEHLPGGYCFGRLCCLQQCWCSNGGEIGSRVHGQSFWDHCSLLTLGEYNDVSLFHEGGL